MVSKLAGVNNPSLSQQYCDSFLSVTSVCLQSLSLTNPDRLTISWTKGTGDNNLTIYTPDKAEHIGIWEQQENQLTFIIPSTIGSHI
jgi:hypothetical protein